MYKRGYFHTALSGALLALSAALFVWPALSHGAPILPGIGSELLLKLNTGNTGQTGVRVLNKSDFGGDISIELIPPADMPSLLAPQGFLLLDNTLRVASTLPSGGRRIRARMDFGRYGGRAGIRARGIRANSIRLLRADVRKGRWVRAITSIRATDVRARFLTETPDELVLGNYGIDQAKQFVWAVLDTSETQLFAIGGVAIPAPPAWLLLLTGSSLMVLVSGRRRQR